MKPPKFLNICFVFIIGIISCNNDEKIKRETINERDDLLGTWRINVVQGNLQGIEKLQMDSTHFFITDSLEYIGEDSGFDFSLKINIRAKGNWKYSNDSLLFYYDKEQLKIIPDYANFSLSLNREGGSIENLDAMAKDTMARELGENICRNLEQEFALIDNNIPVFRGMPIKIQWDTMHVALNDIVLLYIKEK